jgi:hypothetical protein
MTYSCPNEEFFYTIEMSQQDLEDYDWPECDVCEDHPQLVRGEK